MQQIFHIIWHVQICVICCSYMLDEEIKKNITIVKSSERISQLYVSVGHMVQFYLEPSDSERAILLHYESKSFPEESLLTLFHQWLSC